MKWWAVLIFITGGAGAANAPGAVCVAKDLARQDCRLKEGAYNVRLLSETVAWFDGTWHTVEEMPLKGRQSAWEKMRFEMMNGWPILQLWIWDQGAAEGQVQSLHWLTVSLSNRKFVVLAEGVVRKRRPKAEAPKDKPEFLYDAWQPHGAKALKGGGIEWTLAADKKTLKRTDYGL